MRGASAPVGLVLFSVFLMMAESQIFADSVMGVQVLRNEIDKIIVEIEGGQYA